MLYSSNSSARLKFSLIVLVAASTVAVSSSLVYPDCRPPAFTLKPPSSVNRSHCSTFIFDIDAAEGGNTPEATPIRYSTSAGTIDSLTGHLTVPALPSCGFTPVTVKATNACGASTAYTFQINWVGSEPLIVYRPDKPLQTASSRELRFDFNSIDADPCDYASWRVAALSPVSNHPSIDNFGLFSWTADDSERGTAKTFAIHVTDPCGGDFVDTFEVEVLEFEPTVLSIERTQGTLAGIWEYVNITKEFGDTPLGGFDLVIAYDPVYLSFISANPGSGIAFCEWEYFTYRYQEDPDWVTCPHRLVRIVGIADFKQTPGDPRCFAITNGSQLATLKFFVSNDWSLECTSSPVRFVWNDCGDNAISTVSGDTLLISSRVFDFDNHGFLEDLNNEITDTICRYPFSYGGACASCDRVLGQKYQAARQIVFRNGVVEMVCLTVEDYGGDLNLNGVAYEIADAALYADYFMSGLNALDPNPQYRAAQISTSDVNQDSLTLTPADLVTLIRIIVGDALPFSRLEPFHSTATVIETGPEFSLTTPDAVAAVYLEFDIAGVYTVTNLSNLKLDYAEYGGRLHVLLWPSLSGESLMSFISPGYSRLLSVQGAELSSVVVSDYYGNMMTVEKLENVLPSSFALRQNYPNPFNAVTRINLEIPVESEWSLEIFNINGQLVERFEGKGKGIIPVDWNSSDHPSGVYLYKMKAGSFTDSRKMVLMK